jgi:hypothetical protein
MHASRPRAKLALMMRAVGAHKGFLLTRTWGFAPGWYEGRLWRPTHPNPPVSRTCVARSMQLEINSTDCETGPLVLFRKNANEG